MSEALPIPRNEIQQMARIRHSKNVIQFLETPAKRILYIYDRGTILANENLYEFLEYILANIFTYAFTVRRWLILSYYSKLSPAPS